MLFLIFEHFSSCLLLIIGAILSIAIIYIFARATNFRKLLRFTGAAHCKRALHHNRGQDDDNMEKKKKNVEYKNNIEEYIAGT